ncbi:MAG: endonuclease/exonuclease/phosphatase family protein [Nocardioides sp.]
MPPIRPVSRMLAAGALIAAGSLLPQAAHADPLVPVPGTPSHGSGGGTTPSAKPRPQGFDFKLATFNILGSQHTRGPGGYGPGTHRARITARLIKHKNVDVIGMQEVQDDQYRVLHHRLDHYRIWPGTSLGNEGIRLQIAWRERKFRLLDTGSIATAFDHQTQRTPWVKLRNRATGRELYVVDVHNSPRGQEVERDHATQREIDLIHRLRGHHKPVFVVGDANEKREWFCKVVGHTSVRSANGGHASPRSCTPPPRRLRIDWLMGGRRIDFSHYREDDGNTVRKASDHEFIHTIVKVRAPR